MKIYHIQYQLQEETPEWEVVKANSEDEAIKKLKKIIKINLTDYDVEEHEIKCLLDELSILEIIIK